MDYRKCEISYTTRKQLLSTIFSPENKYYNLSIIDVIDDGRARNTLLRKGYRTVSDLKEILSADDGHSDISDRCKNKVFNALMKLQGEPLSDTLGRQMFCDILPDYDDVSIRWIDLFTKDRRISSNLVHADYRKIGSLHCIAERSLELIVGSSMMPRLYILEKALSISPEENLSEIWMSDFSSRRGRITLRQARGEKRADIAAEEGVSAERVRQMTSKFFYGQQPYLEMIDNKLNMTEDRNISLIFPNEDCQKTFLFWKMIEIRSHKTVLPKEEWMKRNLPDLLNKKAPAD